ncbi:aconitate hydratase AcnA [Enterococcus cecorum]|uniref:aconitate hydratase AcnA n=1 Tax=Enterococcus cecorum TaxID=44008 RepID=UPI0032C42CE9
MTFKSQLIVNQQPFHYIDLVKIAEHYQENIHKLPYAIRILLESVARHQNEEITEEALKYLIHYDAKNPTGVIPFKVERVVLQDFTGVPAVVDLAAMRDAMLKLGGSAKEINPEIPVTLVVDHSVQVDAFGNSQAITLNTEREFERNMERYQFLKWAQGSFENFDVVPPETGIIHQVNIESLSPVVIEKEGLLFPDTLQGTDSHTTMINGLGVLGWGVGGIEAEAAILGEASYFPTPEVIGVRFTGQLATGTTATDLALFVTETLRNEKVVGKFVEYFGPSYHQLSLADRATLANMAPEYGATCGYFPIDQETLDYLALTGRTPELIAQVEAYAKANQLFYDEEQEATYTKVIEIDLSQIEPSLAGPKRPQDRISLSQVAQNFTQSVTAPSGPKGFGLPEEELTKQTTIHWQDGTTNTLKTGDLLLAAITSCTNTSNPSVLMTAGLLAKKAVEKGLTVPKYVKTSLAPGSKVVTSYLKASGLLPYFEQLGFYLVGYGCTTCIGNSGPLDEEVTQAVTDSQLLASAVLSGNRNFEGRIHPLIKANYLASPPLVVAYAICGTVRKDLTKESLGTDKEGKPVYLKDIWPSSEEVESYIQKYVSKEAFKAAYAHLFDANERWNEIQTTSSDCYAWDENSTYIANPPFFEDLSADLPSHAALDNLRVLAKLGDSVTTDHISPAGSIGLDSTAGKYLSSRNVPYRDFNSFGSRRGHHEVMMRGTLANIRLQNQLVPEISGGFTRFLPTDEVMSMYDAAMNYQKQNIGTIILAGKDYGMGSSRDWAAKGTQLLGVKAVIAESFERIHRSNLVMMGLIPLEYTNQETAQSLGLTGEEVFCIDFPEKPQINQTITVTAQNKDGKTITFTTKLRFDSPADLRYYQNGGILPMIIRKQATK